MVNNADKVYLELLQDIIDNGVVKGDRTGTGTVSVFGRQIRFNMQEGFPLLTTKKIFTKGVIHELLWFLNGDTNIKYLVDNDVNIWVPDAYKKFLKDSPEPLTGRPMSQPEFINWIKTDDNFAKKWGELGPVYGSQWRKWGTNSLSYKGFNGDTIDWIDQIQVMIDTLKNNPDSRRIIVNAWNPSDLDKMTLPPCHYGFEVNTRELTLKERQKLWLMTKDQEYVDMFEDEECFEYSASSIGHEYMTAYNIPERAISLMWHQRSVDTFLGLPFNIASYGILLHMIASVVNMVPEELVGSLGDVHLYSNHIDKAKEQIKREPRELPTLRLRYKRDLFSHEFDDITFEDYDPHPIIKADISV